MQGSVPDPFRSVLSTVPYWLFFMGKFFVLWKFINTWNLIIFGEISIVLQNVELQNV